MRIFRAMLMLAHLAVVLLLFGTMLNAYVPPRIFPYLNLLSLAFPGLFILHLLLCFVWIVSWKKRAFLFLFLTLFLLQPAKRWINFTSEKTEKGNLKVVTLNAKGGDYGLGEIYSYLKNQNADIVLLQEFTSDFPVQGYEYTANQRLIAISSRFEIHHQEAIVLEEGAGSALFADIKINGQIIRFITVYLHPFSFEKQKVKPADDFEENKAKSKYILKQLIPNFKRHQDEVEKIREVIQKSPYPVILTGDFNAVPNSYEYYQLSAGLQDVFVAVGNGNGTSFHDYKIPIRIDYIFASESLQPVSYQIDRSVKLSDHYPVIAEFKIKNP